MTKAAIENSPEFDPSQPPGLRHPADLMLYREAPELLTEEMRQQDA